MERYRPKPIETNQLFAPTSQYVCFNDINGLIYYSQGVGHLPGKVHASLLYWPDSEGRYASLQMGYRYNKVGQQEKLPKTFEIYIDKCLSEKNPLTGKQSLYVPQEQISDIFDPNLKTSLNYLKKESVRLSLVKKIELIKDVLFKEGIGKLGVFGDLQTNIWPVSAFVRPEIIFLIHGDENRKKFEEIDKKTLHKIGFNHFFKVEFVAS